MDNSALFEPIFIASQFGFGTKIEMNGALQAITDCSADARHSRIPTHKYKEKGRINIYLDMFEKCIDGDEIHSE